MFNSTRTYYTASAKTQTKHKNKQILKKLILNRQFNINVTAVEK